MLLSIIIPTLNEAANISALIESLQTNASKKNIEIIVVDGGSSDDTVALARSLGTTVYDYGQPGRAVQMNHGAQKANGDVLYFIHSDTIPLPTFYEDIEEALRDGFPVGCYRYKFDSPKSLLKINA